MEQDASAEVMTAAKRPGERRSAGAYPWRLAGLLGLLALACVLPFTLSGFRIFQYTQVWAYAVALLGLNMLTGYNGQISLGHGAFFALGGYTTAIMIDRWSVPYGWTIPAAGLLCPVGGVLFRSPALL